MYLKLLLIVYRKSPQLKLRRYDNKFKSVSKLKSVKYNPHNFV